MLLTWNTNRKSLCVYEVGNNNNTTTSDDNDNNTDKL